MHTDWAGLPLPPLSTTLHTYAGLRQRKAGILIACREAMSDMLL